MHPWTEQDAFRLVYLNQKKYMSWKLQRKWIAKDTTLTDSWWINTYTVEERRIIWLLISELGRAPCHFSKNVKDWLNINGLKQFLSLTLPYYLLQGTLKERVYKSCQNRDENPKGYHLVKAIRKFKTNLVKCKENNDSPIEK